MGKDLVRPTDRFTEGMSLLGKSEKILVLDTLELYFLHPSHPSLVNHPLRERDPRIRSITVDKNLRIILRDMGSGRILLLDVGSHDRVYV